MRVFFQVVADDVVYTLGCSPVSHYSFDILFTVGLGRRLGRDRPAGGNW